MTNVFLTQMTNVYVTVLVPPFEVSTMTSSYSDGSNATLYCNTRLHLAADTGFNVSVIWTRSGMVVSNTMARLTNGTFWSSFNIDRVNTTTAGEYNCSFTVSGPFLVKATASNIINIIVTGMYHYFMGMVLLLVHICSYVGSNTPPTLPQAGQLCASLFKQTVQYFCRC